MPNKTRHSGQAERNTQVAYYLLERYPEWAVVAAFYAALHHIDRYASARGKHPASHRIRAQYIASSPELRAIGKDYDTLRTLSERVRYQCPPASDPVCRTDLVQSDVMLRLARVQQHVDQLLASIPKYGA